jgi:hypothetical protein
MACASIVHMSKMTVTLYKPDGNEIVLSNVSYAAIEEKGWLVIAPHDGEVRLFGHTVRTTLPFLIKEEIEG